MQPHSRLPRHFAALSDLALAAAYLLTWAGLCLGDVETAVRHLGHVVMVEFVLLMLGLPLVLFLSPPLRKEFVELRSRRAFLGVSGVLVFALVVTGIGLSVTARAPWPLLAVALLLAGKINLYFRPPRTKADSDRILADAVLRLTVMFFLLLPCVLVPLPAFGVPNSMDEFVDFRPAGLMAWGALYFGLFGLFGYRLDAVLEAAHRPTADRR